MTDKVNPPKTDNNQPPHGEVGGIPKDRVGRWTLDSLYRRIEEPFWGYYEKITLAIPIAFLRFLLATFSPVILFGIYANLDRSTRAEIIFQFIAAFSFSLAVIGFIYILLSEKLGFQMPKRSGFHAHVIAFKRAYKRLRKKKLLKDVEPVALIMVLNDIGSIRKDELLKKVAVLKKIERSTAERMLRAALDTRLIVEVPSTLLVSPEIRIGNNLDPTQVLAMCRIYALTPKGSKNYNSLVEFAPYQFENQAWTDKKWRDVLIWESHLSNNLILEKTLIDLTLPRSDRKEYLKRCYLALAIITSGAFPALEMLNTIYQQIKGYDDKKK